MSYEVINKDLMIEACNVEDLTMELVERFLKTWNSNLTINSMIFFVEKNGTVVLNKNNPDYECNKGFVEKYLKTGNKDLSKRFSGHFREFAELLNQAIDQRKYAEALSALRYAHIDEEQIGVVEAICKKYGDGPLGKLNIYTYGVIEGKRQERARRKKKKAKTKTVNKQICSLGAELGRELSKATPEDYLQVKLMMLSSAKHTGAKSFLQAVFELAEERRPLLIEKK